MKINPLNLFIHFLNARVRFKIIFDQNFINLVLLIIIKNAHKVYFWNHSHLAVGFYCKALIISG